MSTIDIIQQQLFNATIRGQLDKVQALLQQGASLTATYKPDKRSILHAAAQAGQLEVVQHLIDAGAVVDARTNLGCTPLHLAAGFGHKAAAAALLDRGASVTATDNAGWTPLHHAGRGGRTALFGMLLDAGADREARSVGQQTPLHCACMSRSCKAVEELLRLGAEVNGQDSNGHTPLHVSSFIGFANIVQLLLDCEAAIDLRDAEGMTPLLLASKNCQAEVVEMLLECGAQPDARDSSGNMALHLAALHGCGYISDLLQVSALRAHINTPNSAGQTLLHIALEAEEWHLEDVGALLAAGANADVLYGAGAVDSQGVTIPEGTHPLQRAIQLGFVLAVPLLVTPSSLHDLFQGHLLEGEGEGPQDNQQQLPGDWPPAVSNTMAALDKGLHTLLVGARSDPVKERCLKQAVSCFGAVGDVLGTAGVSSLLGDLLEGETQGIQQKGHLLLAALHSMWVDAAKHRWEVIYPLQLVLNQHLLQQLPTMQQPGPGDAGLWVAGGVAARSGNWPLFVQQMEHQTCLEPALATSKVHQVAVMQSPAKLLSCVKGLCEALVVAQRQAAHSKADEVTAAMVKAVQAWEQHGRRRRTVGTRPGP
jgi:ankyrin repeat protein